MSNYSFKRQRLGQMKLEICLILKVIFKKAESFSYICSFMTFVRVCVTFSDRVLYSSQPEVLTLANLQPLPHTNQNSNAKTKPYHKAL